MKEILELLFFQVGNHLDSSHKKNYHSKKASSYELENSGSTVASSDIINLLCTGQSTKPVLSTQISFCIHLKLVTYLYQTI